MNASSQVAALVEPHRFPGTAVPLVEHDERLTNQIAGELVLVEGDIPIAQSLGNFVGRSQPLRAVLRQIEIVAPTDSTVLISGETGTGKELIARAIHDLSRRRDRPLVKINCAAIPAGLLETELFGHERGAFTGAVSRKLGQFEAASGGTLFLDEIGEMPFKLQAKLLRVLQDQELSRVGSTRTIKIDVRLVAATNRDLARLIEERRFRDDLYYRLNVFPICAPPLRERPEDIEALVRHFVRLFAARMGRRIEFVPADTLEALRRQPWPGNIRELQNLIERAVILSAGAWLNVPLGDAPGPPCSQGDGVSTLDELKRVHIIRALEGSNWIIGGRRGAAARLGMKRTTLQSLMKRLAISRPI